MFHFLFQEGHLLPLDDLVRGCAPAFQLQHGHYAHWQQEVCFCFALASIALLKAFCPVSSARLVLKGGRRRWRSSRWLCTRSWIVEIADIFQIEGLAFTTLSGSTCTWSEVMWCFVRPIRVKREPVGVIPGWGVVLCLICFLVVFKRGSCDNAHWANAASCVCTRLCRSTSKSKAPSCGCLIVDSKSKETRRCHLGLDEDIVHPDEMRGALGSAVIPLATVDWVVASWFQMTYYTIACLCVSVTWSHGERWRKRKGKRLPENTASYLWRPQPRPPQMLRR